MNAPTPPKHIVTIAEAREAGARAIMASWDYTRTVMPPRLPRDTASRAIGVTALVTGTLSQITEGQIDPSWLVGLFASSIKELKILYYELSNYHEEWVTQERLKEEIERLRRQPTIYTRVCRKCDGTAFVFRDEPYNPLSQQVHRVCTRCGCGETRVTNGRSPWMLYNAHDVTRHMSFFGAVEGRLIFGVNTMRGLGTEAEEQSLRHLLLG